MPETVMSAPLKKFALEKGIVGGPFGSSLGSKDYVDNGVPVIRGQNLASDGYFDDRKFVFVSDRKADSELSRNMALPGDIVFTQRGTLGQVGLVPEGQFARYVISQSQMRMRVNSAVADARFIYYCFRDTRMLELIKARAIATGVPHINLGILSELEVPDHPLPTQRAIGEALGALDDKIAINERIAGCAHDLGACYFQHGLVATGERVSLGELEASGRLELGDGYRTKKSEHGEPGLPILRSAEVRDGRIEPEFVDFVHEDYRAAMGSKVSRPGDVVLTTKGAFGRTAIMWSDAPDFAYSPQLCYFRVTESSPFSSYYFYHWLRGSEFLGQALGMKGQTDMADYLSLRDLRSLKITLPEPATEERVSEKLCALHKMAESSGRESRVLAELRDTLLPKLMSGELRIRDAERQVGEAT